MKSRVPLPPPLKAIVVNGKKTVSENGVVSLTVASPSSTRYSIDYSDDSTIKPQTFTLLQKTGTVTLDKSKEIDGVMNDYQGTLTSTGSLTIDTGESFLLSNIDLTSLEEDAVYVFSIIGSKSFGYFCAINKFE